MTGASGLKVMDAIGRRDRGKKSLMRIVVRGGTREVMSGKRNSIKEDSC